MLDDILGAVGDVLSAPRRALWSIAPGLHDSETGDVLSGSQVAHNAFGVDPESTWGKALGFGLEVAGDPLPLLGGLATRGIGAGAKAAANAGKATEEIAPMLNARRGFAMVKDFAPDYVAGEEATRNLGAKLGMEGLPDYGGRVIGQPAQMLDNANWTKVLDDAGDKFARNSGLNALMYQEQGLGLLPSGTTNAVARHETMHGLIRDAMTTGDSSHLGLLGRASAGLQRSGNSFVRGLGEIADEAAAHAAEKRGFFPQAGNALNFLMVPRAGYAAQFARTSPLASAVYTFGPTVGAGMASAPALAYATTRSRRQPAESQP